MNERRLIWHVSFFGGGGGYVVVILGRPGEIEEGVNLGSLAWIAHTDTDPAEM